MVTRTIKFHPLLWFFFGRCVCFFTRWLVQVGGSNYFATSLFLYKIKEVHDYLIKWWISHKKNKVGNFVFCNIVGKLIFIIGGLKRRFSVNWSCTAWTSLTRFGPRFAHWNICMWDIPPVGPVHKSSLYTFPVSFTTNQE